MSISRQLRSIEEPSFACIFVSTKKQIMKSIRTEIVIDAPISKVWNTLIDFDSYKDWNPFVHIEGKPIVGTKLRNRMFIEGQKEQVFTPELLEVAKEKELRWLGTMGIKGLFDGEHYFKLQAEGPNKTRFIHGENFKGILVWPIMKMVGKATLKGFNAMNVAMAERVS